MAENVMKAVLDMNSFNVINLPAPATINSPVRLVDVIDPGVVLTIPPVGTSGSTVPLLNGNNTWSGTQTFNAQVTFTSVPTINGLPGLSNSLTPGGQPISGLVANLSAAGNVSTGSANQSTWFIQANNQISNSLASYQKNGLFVWSFQNDPSTYSPLLTRDLVSITALASAKVSNARVWAGNFVVSNSSGYIASMNGLEVDVGENNAAVTSGSTPGSSCGISIVSQGSFPGTSGLVLGGPSGFHDSVVIQTGSTPIGGTALLIVDGYGDGQNTLFSIDSLGNTKANSVSTNAYVSSLTNTATPAGGANPGIVMGTSFVGVFFGTGLPTVAAAQGSIYLRTDGSNSSTRLYVNTNGSTGWTNVTTAS